jgi:hypothetical protein
MRTGKAYQPAKARIRFGGNNVPGNLAHQGNDDAAEDATPVKLTQLEDRDGVASVLVTLHMSPFKLV